MVYAELGTEGFKIIFTIRWQAMTAVKCTTAAPPRFALPPVNRIIPLISMNSSEQNKTSSPCPRSQTADEHFAELLMSKVQKLKAEKLIHESISRCCWRRKLKAWNLFIRKEVCSILLLWHPKLEINALGRTQTEVGGNTSQEKQLYPWVPQITSLLPSFLPSPNTGKTWSCRAAPRALRAGCGRKLKPPVEGKLCARRPVFSPFRAFVPFRGHASRSSQTIHARKARSTPCLRTLPSPPAAKPFPRAHHCSPRMNARASRPGRLGNPLPGLGIHSRQQLLPRSGRRSRQRRPVMTSGGAQLLLGPGGRREALREPRCDPWDRRDAGVARSGGTMARALFCAFDFW